MPEEDNTRLFLSYSQLDSYPARKLETALKQAGYEVWRDERRSTPSSGWSRSCAEALLRSDGVVVLWSGSGHESKWMRSERLAAQALNRPLAAVKFGSAGDLPAELGAGIELRLDRLDWVIAEIAQALRNSAAPKPELPAGSFLPAVRGDDFIDRDAELIEIYLALFGDGSSSPSRHVAVVSGPSGVGKSRLAVEFARCFAPALTKGSYWLNGAGNWRQEFLQLAQRLGLAPAGRAEESAEVTLAGVQRYLAREPEILLVLDEVESVAQLDREIEPGFRPAALMCRLLVTTPDEQPLPNCSHIRLNGLDPDQAVALLTQDNPQPLDLDAARVICAAVNGMPLSLVLVRALMRRRQGREGVREQGSKPEKLMGALYETISHEYGRRLLKIAGQMPKGELIPEQRLALFAGPADTADAFAAARAELIELALAEPQPGETLAFHPLVHKFGQKLTPGEEQPHFLATCADNLERAYRSAVSLTEMCQRRGVKSVMADIEIALDWAIFDGALRDSLSTLWAMLDEEAPNDGAENVSIAQQLLYQAHRRRMSEYERQLRSMLESQGMTFFQPVRNDILSLAETRHSDWIAAIAFSPGGGQILTGSHDHTMILWDRTTLKPLRRYTGHNGNVSGVAFTPDGKYLLSSSYDNRLLLWEGQSALWLRRFKGHLDRVKAIAIAPDGKTAVSGSFDNSLILWSLSDGSARQTLYGHAGAVNSVVFSADGKLILSASDDRTLIVWDAASGSRVRQFNGHKSAVYCGIFLPGGRHIASGGADRMIIIWDLANGNTVKILEGHRDTVWTMATLNQGRDIISGSEDRSLILWDVKAGGVLARLFTGAPVMALAVSGDEIVTGDTDGRVRLYRLRRSPSR